MPSQAEIQAVADSIEAIALAIKKAKVQIDQVLASNSAHAIDWTSQEAEDAIADRDYTKEEVSNAIGSYSTFNSAWWDAGHGGNMEKLTPPVVG